MNYSFKIILVLFLITFLGLKSVTEINAQSAGDSLHTSVYESMKPRNIDSEYYSELWTYHLDLNNGYQIVYAFTLSEFGSHQKRNADVKFQTSWKNGESIVVRKKYENNQFKYDSTNNRIQLHPDQQIYAKNQFQKEHLLVFKAENDGHKISAEFEIQSNTPSMLRNKGALPFDNGIEAGLTFPMPHGEVKGTLAVNGDTLKNLSGIAYMDHIYMTNTAFKVYEKGYRIKIGDNHNGMIMTAFKPRNRSNLIGYGIEFENGTPHLIEPIRHKVISKDEVRGITYARKNIFYFEDRPPVTVQIDSVFNTYTVLDEYGSLKGFFAKKILGGKLIQFNGYAHTGDGERLIFNNFVTK